MRLQWLVLDERDETLLFGHDLLQITSTEIVISCRSANSEVSVLDALEYLNSSLLVSLQRPSPNDFFLHLRVEDHSHGRGDDGED